MTSPAPIGVGLIGAGYAARTFHIPLIAANRDLSLKAMGVRRPEAAAAPPAAVPVVSIDALLADPEVAMVVITTPPESHAALAIRALQAGKHVVVEKPAAPTYEEIVAMGRAAKRAGKVLTVFHNRRWDSDFLTVQRLIGEGVLGEVVELTSSWDRLRPVVRDRWREQSGPGAGLWFDLGSHLLDQALHLFGAPMRIETDILRQRLGAQVDDAFHVRMIYPNLRVTLKASSLAGVAGPRFVVNGRQATFVKYGLDPQEGDLLAGRNPAAPGWGADLQPGRLFTFGDAQEAVETSVRCEPGNYGAFYRGLVAAIRDGAPPPVRIEEAEQVVRLLGQCLQSP